jgi:hypothetical protein
MNTSGTTIGMRCCIYGCADTYNRQDEQGTAATNTIGRHFDAAGVSGTQQAIGLYPTYSLGHSVIPMRAKLRLVYVMLMNSFGLSFLPPRFG